MKKMKFNTIAARSIKTGLAIGALVAAQVAFACSVDNWSDSTGSITPGDPAAEGVARYQGLCGLEVTGTAYVQDESPGGIDRIVARFYVLNNNTAPAEIYGGFGNTSGGSPVFSVELDDSGNVTLTDSTTGRSVGQSGSTKWLSVEIDWARGAGSGAISLSVNGQTAAEDTGFNNGAAATLQSVRLGNLNGAAGTIGFDSYESRRSTAVGRLVHPDPNGDGNPTGINSQDFAAMVDDFSGNSLASGTPDCNEDGEPLLNSQDFACIVNAFLNQ